MVVRNTNAVEHKIGESRWKQEFAAMVLNSEVKRIF